MEQEYPSRTSGSLKIVAKELDELLTITRITKLLFLLRNEEDNLSIIIFYFCKKRKKILKGTIPNGTGNLKLPNPYKEILVKKRDKVKDYFNFSPNDTIDFLKIKELQEALVYLHVLVSENHI